MDAYSAMKSAGEDSENDGHLTDGGSMFAGLGPGNGRKRDPTDHRRARSRERGERPRSFVSAARSVSSMVLVPRGAGDFDPSDFARTLSQHSMGKKKRKAAATASISGRVSSETFFEIPTGISGAGSTRFRGKRRSTADLRTAVDATTVAAFRLASTSDGPEGFALGTNTQRFLQRVHPRLSVCYLMTHLILVVILLAAAVAWIVFNVQRLANAKPVMEIGKAVVGQMQIPPIVVCSPHITAIICQTSFWSSAADDVGKCPDGSVSRSGLNVTAKLLTVGDFPQLAVWNSAWSCFLFNPSKTFNFDPATGVERVVLVATSDQLTNVSQENTASISFTSPQWILIGKVDITSSSGPLMILLVKSNLSNRTWYSQPYTLDATPTVLSFDFDWLMSPAVVNTPFTRIEVETGGAPQVDLTWKTKSQQLYDGFANSPNIWALIRLYPDLSKSNIVATTKGLKVESYSVETQNGTYSFTFPNFIGTFGGVATGSFALYIVLFGSAKINPWGVMQRWFFKSTPFLSVSEEDDKESLQAVATTLDPKQPSAGGQVSLTPVPKRSQDLPLRTLGKVSRLGSPEHDPHVTNLKDRLSSDHSSSSSSDEDTFAGAVHSNDRRRSMLNERATPNGDRFIPMTGSGSLGEHRFSFVGGTISSDAPLLGTSAAGLGSSTLLGNSTDGEPSIKRGIRGEVEILRHQLQQLRNDATRGFARMHVMERLLSAYYLEDLDKMDFEGLVNLSLGIEGVDGV
ncbi:hypothetical protein HDU93_005064 [Gonapodya sp. JEL0774]|nr:hypothetical protein HDU93_005064 [Gonapodya sp. JEL0774]